MESQALEKSWRNIRRTERMNRITSAAQAAHSQSIATAATMQIVPVEAAASTSETKLDVVANHLDGDHNDDKHSNAESGVKDLTERTFRALIGTDEESSISGAAVVAFEKRRRQLHRSLDAFRKHAEHATITGREQGRFFVVTAGEGARSAEQEDE